MDIHEKLILLFVVLIGFILWLNFTKKHFDRIEEDKINYSGSLMAAKSLIKNVKTLKELLEIHLFILKLEQKFSTTNHLRSFKEDLKQLRDYYLVRMTELSR